MLDTILLQRLTRSREPVVRQYDRADCGPAALLSVLRAQGGDSSLSHVRQLAATTARGTTLADLARAAVMLGFEARGATGTLEALAQTTLPCIAHLVLPDGWQHYVVVYRITARTVVVGDPADGRRTLAHDEFSALWRHKAVLLLTPGPALTANRPLHWMHWLAPALRPEESWLTQAVFLGILYAAVSLSVSWFVQVLLDRLIPARASSRIVLTGLVLLALQVARAGIGYYRQRFVVQAGRRVSVRVTADFLRHVFRLPATFFDTRRTGDVVARLSDATAIQAALIRIFGTAATDVAVVVGVLAGSFLIAPPIGWVAIAAIPMYGLVVTRGMRRVRAVQYAAQQSYAAVEASFVESIGAISQIRAFGRSDLFATSNARQWDRYQAQTEGLGLSQARMGRDAELTGSVLLMGALVLGALLAMHRQLQIGELVAAYSLLVAMLPSIGRLIDVQVALQGAMIASTRLMDTLLLPAEATGGTRAFGLEHALELRGAAFRWPRGATLFEQVDLPIVRGQITGLWGPSGSGKSTIVQVLQRNYHLAAGELLIDGAPASGVPLDEYRRHVAVVPSDVTVFSGTVAFNLSLGRDGITPPAIVACVEALGLAPFFQRFEEGLATFVGETGRHLSSGERQVIGLVRALLLDPSVLIIDEAVNAMDDGACELVLGCLRQYAKRHAVLLISHDSYVLGIADRRYALARGRLVESAPCEPTPGVAFPPDASPARTHQRVLITL